MNTRSARRLSLTVVACILALALPGQDPAPAKGPDKEILDKLATLKEVVADKKFARDAEGVSIIDDLLKKAQAGVDPKDATAIVKGLDGVLSTGKVRPPDNTSLYNGAVAALGRLGPEGAKVLKAAYSGKRFPDKKEWVPLREQLLKNIGRTKDESMVKFLVDEARRSPEAALQAAAGEALGNYEESKDAIRKEIVGDLIVTWGELSEVASQLGSNNVAAQNAQDRLSALSDKWNTSFAKLTRQNFSSFREWQAWYNKNKGVAW